jgi:hypothetical protein
MKRSYLTKKKKKKKKRVVFVFNFFLNGRSKARVLASTNQTIETQKRAHKAKNIKIPYGQVWKDDSFVVFYDADGCINRTNETGQDDINCSALKH